MVRDPDRDRRVLRADPRAQQHEPGRAHGRHDVLERLQRGEAVPLDEFTEGCDPITRLIIGHGGLFPFERARDGARATAADHAARPMTMAEKILAPHLVGRPGERCVKPGDAVVVTWTAATATSSPPPRCTLPVEEYGGGYAVRTPSFAVFEDHLIYADGVPGCALPGKIETLRDCSGSSRSTPACATTRRGRRLARHLPPGGARAVHRAGRLHPGHRQPHLHGRRQQRARLGMGATEYAGLVHSGFTFVEVPESIRFELNGRLGPGVTAKDVILYILATTPSAGDARPGDGVRGRGLASLSMDERATLANMATECSASGDLRGRRGDVRWMRAAAGSRQGRCARARGRPDPAPTTPAGCTDRPRGDRADGRPPRRPRPRHPLDPTNGAASPSSARSRSTSPTAAPAPPARRTTSTSRPRHRRGGRAGRRVARGVDSSSSSAAEVEPTPASAATSSFARPACDHRPRLRRLHRLRARRLETRPGHGLGHQPQLQGRCGPGKLYLQPPHRRRLGDRRLASSPIPRGCSPVAATAR